MDTIYQVRADTGAREDYWPRSTHRKDLITVADGQITHLAQRSKELDQETRVTVYTFSNIVECVVYAETLKD
jgi:hypothetical protein